MYNGLIMFVLGGQITYEYIYFKMSTFAVHIRLVTTHQLSIERADWPKLHDMLKHGN